MRLAFRLMPLLLLVNASSFAQHANRNLSNLLNPTAVNVWLLPANNNVQMLGSVTNSWKHAFLDGNLYLLDSLFLHIKGTRNNFMGQNAGFSITTGTDNTAGGFRSLYTISTASFNTAYGSFALTKNTTGGSNVAIGSSALRLNISGNGNVGIGHRALTFNTTGHFNTAVGIYTLEDNTTGSFNSAFGAEALRSNTTGNYNVAMGLWALVNNTTGSNNSAYGYSALYGNTTGSSSTAIGTSALRSNKTGAFNTAIGYATLTGNTSGSRNTATGNEALRFNSSGFNNTATGNRALYSNKTGSDNTAAGDRSLFNNTTGGSNAAVGYASMYSNKTGNFNTALGKHSLFNDSSRHYNVGVGYNAGGNGYNGSNNTLVGAHSYANANGYNNSSALGYNSRITASNQVVLGNSSITSIVAGTGFVIYSDGRFKKDIKENVPGLEFIKELRPVTYTYDIHSLDAVRDGKVVRTGEADEIADKEAFTELENARKEKEKKIYTGLVAQDVEKVAEKMGYDFSGIYKPQNENDVYGLSYSEFIMPLIKAVQELDKKTNEIEELRKEIRQLKELFSRSSNEGSDSFLGQNVPNPFSNTTIIPYQVKSGSRSAMLQITETGSGKVIRRLPVDVNARQTTLSLGLVAKGSYIYTLMVDGRKVDSRQMLAGSK